MQILTVFIAVYALYASQASAGCYDGGAKWGNKDDAVKKLTDACSSELVGNYAPGGDRKACRPGLGGGSYEFEIRNTNVYSIYISQDACVADLRIWIDNCTYGGKTGDMGDLGIFKRGDPNSGNCGR
ncbi:hypothetical protein G7Y79_00032g067070 [Physcia stellaris]|nr:hypothetical protein G7Y79_00032g067070 [Physcia stellaris]